MDYSQNYNLKLPEESDSYSVEDFNNNFSQIDEKLHFIEETTSNNATDIYNAGRDIESLMNSFFTVYERNSTNELDFRITQPEVPDGTCSVAGYTGNDIKIKIPHFIHGLLVTEIGYYFGAGTAAPVEEIEIPFTVEKIDNGAFASMSDLLKVTFEKGSRLKKIGSMIFDINSGIRELRVPETIETICMEAFAYGDIQTLIFEGTDNLESIDTEGIGHPGNLFSSQTDIYENGGEIKDYIDDNNLSNHYYTLIANDKSLSRILQEIRIGSQSIQDILAHYGI